ncbi:VPA1269 family protein [Mesorhizobium koreense]|uniref:VPA1269 family protein n=1 Tax=Mesorhizobium koreense TaxID=3074855 RepID=UPI00287BB266|nr:VPA1269 family protein [Mesorhizobium sp. WR6]
MLTLRFIDNCDDALLISAAGIMANTSDEIVVVTTMPTTAELRAAVEKFEVEIRSEFRRLFEREYSDIKKSFGSLRLLEKNSSGREGELYGLTLQNKRNPPRFSHLTNKSVLQGLIRLGILSEHSSKGQPRTRLDRGSGHIADLVGALSQEMKLRLITEVLSGDLDEALLVDQSAEVGFEKLKQIVRGSDDPVEILEHLLRAASDFFLEQKLRTAGTPAGKGTGRVYAPAWFAQYLAKIGVWLWPFRLESSLFGFYPTRWLPIAFRLSVPSSMRSFAEHCLSAAAPNVTRGTSKERIGWVFLASALASNTWHGGSLATDALVRFKEQCQTEGRLLASSSLNHLLFEAARHFDVRIPELDNFEAFTKNKRLAQGSLFRFRWCEKPSPTNTRLVSRILGREITTVPDFVRDWAADLARAIELMTCDVGTAEAVLNCWLAYILHLGQSAPRSFREVKRLIHVNDSEGTEQASESCFVGFMKARLHLIGRANAPRAISMLVTAWHKLRAAQRWSEPTSCPFDLKLDRIAKFPQKKTRTSRNAIDEAVLEIISLENRRDDFIFARNYGKASFMYNLRNVYTDKYEDVFWPAVPICVEIIINSGARNSAARWADSGEGDEFVFEQISGKKLPNDLPTMQKCRRESFLQKLFVPSDDTHASTMHFCVDKIKNEHDIPWCPPHIEDLYWRMCGLQKKFNPIRAPIPAIDSNSKKRRKNDTVKHVFPLFRMPDVAVALPFADYTLLQYWYALLVHCQPIVDERLGYHYPLLDASGKPIYDIHSLRVTLATHLSNQGATLGTMRDILGHSSIAMAAHYDASGPETIGSQLRHLYAIRQDAARKAIARDPEMLAVLAREAVRPSWVEDHVGIELLLEHKSSRSASFDAFFHGICPGGRCKEGGKRISPGKYEPVWRDRACGECRFRVIGPRFLPGMRDRADLLMIEFKMSQEGENSLNLLQEKENDQLAKHQRQAEIREEQILQTNLYREWQTENSMIQLCRTVNSVGNQPNEVKNDLLISRSSVSPEKFRFIPTETHSLVAVQRIIKQSREDPALAFQLPVGTEEYRNKMLRKFMVATDISSLFYRIPESEQQNAMDAIGDMVVNAAADSNDLQEILEGDYQEKRELLVAEISSVLAKIGLVNLTNELTHKSNS